MLTQVEEARRALDYEIEMLRRKFDRDIYYGCRDQEAGVYDEWYEKYREDGGRAYKAAWRDAQEKNPKEFTTIEA